MKRLLSRRRLTGKLKVVLFLLFTISVFFITYQFINYANLNQFENDESAAYLRQRQQKNEIPIKAASSIEDKKESLDVGKLSKSSKGRDKRDKSVTGFVIGVAPEYQKYYSQQTKKFSCLSLKTRKISWDKVNDDYCDCPVDGSDEPSTSACMNGKFYCTKSSKSYPEYIPSSRVNDLICDCCDGSDEYLSPGLCPIKCK